MNSSKNNLNLARKWRPKTFDQIAGQKIPISILQNSLFSQKFFPVYLFAGQRGCGKTSSARIFGAAVNCKNLYKFQENPKDYKVPCLECDSCKAMLKVNHPDFIEIDAASHTGVENVRQILEVCSYLPILGNKKIYLIDEAHMLSKAAFNALLKILEEPPTSALFILATTEIQKFPETVLSRCFQIIFKSIENIDLKEHIQQICNSENIEIEDQAISIIIQETEGSARDAINLLERVRFSESKITVESLLKVLGKISENELFDIFEILLEQNPQNLLNKLTSPNLENIDPQIFWNSLVQLCRSLLWVKFKSEKLPIYFNNIQKLNQIAQKCSINRLNAIFQLLWTQEELFLKTPQKKILLETILLQICQQTNIVDLEDILKAECSNTLEHNSTAIKKNIFSEQNPIKEKNVFTQKTPPEAYTTSNQKINTQNNPPSEETIPSQQTDLWQIFLSKIPTLNDPMLTSIFNQSKFIKIDLEKKLVLINLKNNSSFFKDKINESKSNWLSCFRECFTECNNFDFIQIQNLQPETMVQKHSEKTTAFMSPPATIVKNNLSSNSINLRQYPTTQANLSDKDKWPKTNLILKYFPGKIKSSSN